MAVVLRIQVEKRHQAVAVNFQTRVSVPTEPVVPVGAAGAKGHPGRSGSVRSVIQIDPISGIARSAHIHDRNGAVTENIQAIEFAVVRVVVVSVVVEVGSIRRSVCDADAAHCGREIVRQENSSPAVITGVDIIDRNSTQAKYIQAIL